MNFKNTFFLIWFFEKAEKQWHPGSTEHAWDTHLCL
jgi:hypothetical protein